jgi:tetratricopeptide (TPR) repeat protein
MAWCRLGDFQLDCDEIDAALFSFSRAVDLEPKRSVVRRGYAVALMGKGQFDEAKRQLLQSIEIEPTPQAYIYLGDIYVRLDDEVEAEACFRQALQIENDNEEALYNLGVSLQRQGRIGEAIGLLRRAVEIDPSYAIAFLELGAILSGKQQNAEAEAMLRKSIELDESLFLAHAYLADLLARTNRILEAEDSYKRSCEVAGEVGAPHRFLGLFYEELGRYLEAEACYRQAVRIEGTDPNNTLRMGKFLLTHGKKEEARFWLAKTMEVDPFYSDAAEIERLMNE